MQEEIWKDIPQYEELYQVSNLGNVRNVKFKNIYNLTNNLGCCGYYRVNLRKDKKTKTFRVHQLVAMAFLNHTPCKFKLLIDHKNDIKTDNRVENLQIVTNRFNTCKTQGKYSSQYKGVYFVKKHKTWAAAIRINGPKIHLGSFKNEYDAHLAYQNKLKEIEKI